MLSGCSSEQDPDGQERGLLFSGSDCDSALQGTEQCLLWAHTEHSRQHIPLGTVLWFGTSQAVTLQHMCLPGHQLQAIPGRSTAVS